MTSSTPAVESSRRKAREDADIESSSERYQRRFRGSVGRWFLELQTRLTLACLEGLGPGATVLDVGGGHAQTAPALIEAGSRVTVVGSDPVCGRLLVPWTSLGKCRFHVADLQTLPYKNRAFDAVICYRMLAHSIAWTGLIAELCRVSRGRVIIDYPARRSVNFLSHRLFDLKRSIEGVTTRRFTLYGHPQVMRAFEHADFRVTAEHPQFFLPMVLYRLGGIAVVGRALETSARVFGLTQKFGSPVILRADRKVGT
jgi:ubiquinone/menaquinone biosynthesis C-methylase UbiE